jgi:hypothetical protein
MPSSVFLQAIERAQRYQITSMETVERIALLQMTQDVARLPLVEVDEAYLDREAYLEGSLTDAPDLSIYDQLLEDDDE